RQPPPEVRGLRRELHRRQPEFRVALTRRHDRAALVEIGPQPLDMGLHPVGRGAAGDEDDVELVEVDVAELFRTGKAIEVAGVARPLEALEGVVAAEVYSEDAHQPRSPRVHAMMRGATTAWVGLTPAMATPTSLPACENS